MNSDHSVTPSAPPMYPDLPPPYEEAGQKQVTYRGHSVQSSGDKQNFIHSDQTGAAMLESSHSRNVSHSPMDRFQSQFSSYQQQGINNILGGPAQGSLWLAYRLGALKNYELDFIIDNSASMDTRDGMVNPETRRKMTRLEEACSRLEQVADLLSYIPVKGITIRSFSQQFPPINLAAKPDDIAQQIKNDLYEISQGRRIGSTPLYPTLIQSLSEDTQNARIIYVFNDGEPNSGGTAADVCSMLKNRNAERNPVCLIACTDDEDSIGWMNDADSLPNIHVVDDFQSELKEVKAHQGQSFPFNEGFYLMSTLLGPIDPLFDKADENHIYDQANYQEICGGSVSSEEYEYYCTSAGIAQYGMHGYYAKTYCNIL